MYLIIKFQNFKTKLKEHQEEIDTYTIILGYFNIPLSITDRIDRVSVKIRICEY